MLEKYLCFPLLQRCKTNWKIWKIKIFTRTTPLSNWTAIIKHHFEHRALLMSFQDDLSYNLLAWKAWYNRLENSYTSYAQLGTKKPNLRALMAILPCSRVPNHSLKIEEILTLNFARCFERLSSGLLLKMAPTSNSSTSVWIFLKFDNNVTKDKRCML